MAQVDPRDNSLTVETLEESKTALGPSLGIEESGNGYIRAEELEEDSVFSRSISSLEDYDDLTDENILMNPRSSARVLENYFGQHSRSDEPLYDFLDVFDVDTPELENNFVLDLSLEDYDGKKHINYHEGNVSKELIDYLDSESSWSSQTYFMEECGKLFIQNSP